MKNKLKILICSVIVLLSFSQLAVAEQVTLSWQASPTADVVGYKIYYNPSNSTLPFNGTDALEGPSPLDVGSQLSATISGLRDDIPYYFAVTAYDAAGYESSYSNITSNRWMPELLTPANNATNEPIAATFQWTTAPAGLDLNYTLYYGTDPDLVATVAPIITNSPNSGNISLLLAGLLSAAVLIFAAQRLPKKRFAVAGACFALCLALTSCGGGGGGSDSSPARGTEGTEGTESPATAEKTVYSVNVGTSDYYQVFDLNPATTYYWKVIGTDVSDPSKSYSSTTFQFTTESF